MSQSLAPECTAARESHVAANAPPRDSHVAVTRPQQVRVEAVGLTDVGLVRSANEDNLSVLHHLHLFMVADGMGGAAAGEVASKMALDNIRATFEDSDLTWPLSGATPSAELLTAGIRRAHSAIVGISLREEDKRGMGTTFAGLLALDNRVLIAHVGDSRVYRLRGRKLDLLTEDHSLLNHCVRTGQWNPDEADLFPWPNAVTQAVGALDDHGAPLQLEVEVRDDVPEPGDIYLLCSDGLHGMVDDQQIAHLLLKHDDITQAAARLVELANDQGGKDNITVVLVRVVETGAR
jgi:protein phosphatase